MSFVPDVEPNKRNKYWRHKFNVPPDSATSIVRLCRHGWYTYYNIRQLPHSRGVLQIIDKYICRYTSTSRCVFVRYDPPSLHWPYLHVYFIRCYSVRPLNTAGHFRSLKLYVCSLYKIYNLIPLKKKSSLFKCAGDFCTAAIAV